MSGCCRSSSEVEYVATSLAARMCSMCDAAAASSFSAEAEQRHQQEASIVLYAPAHPASQAQLKHQERRHQEASALVTAGAQAASQAELKHAETIAVAKAARRLGRLSMSSRSSSSLRLSLSAAAAAASVEMKGEIEAAEEGGGGRREGSGMRPIYEFVKGLQVFVVGARFLPKMRRGWFRRRTCDAYLKIFWSPPQLCRGAEEHAPLKIREESVQGTLLRTTKVCKRTSAPAWNETLSFEFAPEEPEASARTGVWYAGAEPEAAAPAQYTEPGADVAHRLLVECYDSDDGVGSTGRSTVYLLY
jgi:hypothetical protein